MDIKRRLAIARSAITRLTRKFVKQCLPTNTKLNYLVISIATHARKIWTFTTADDNGINAFEMWARSIMLRISRRDRLTNNNRFMEELDILLRLLE